MIAVIILLRRQFQHPEILTQKGKPSKEIELKAPSNPTEETGTGSRSPNLLHAPKACIRVAADLEEEREVNKADDGLIATNNTREPQSLTETTTEVTLHCPGGADVEVDCKETSSEVEKDRLEHHTDDKNS